MFGPTVFALLLSSFIQVRSVPHSFETLIEFPDTKLIDPSETLTLPDLSIEDGPEEEVNQELSAFVESRAECDPSEGMLKCYNETSLKLCIPAGQRIIPCRGSRCNPDLNICMSSRVDTQDVYQFSCPPQDGYYPDLSSCRKYYFCASGKPKEYTCDFSDVYNPKVRACVRHLPGNTCHRFQCLRKHGRLTPYSGEPNIYAVCSDNRPLSLLRCPDGEAMNEREQRCKVHCEKEGLIANSKSCMKYFECTRTFTGFKMREGECPPGAWFDPKISQCTMLKKNEDCPSASLVDENHDGTTVLPAQE